MTWGELADNFQTSFLGGRFKDWKHTRYDVVEFTDLKMTADAKAIPLATVVFDASGITAVYDVNEGVAYSLWRLTKEQYAIWKAKDDVRD